MGNLDIYNEFYENPHTGSLLLYSVFYNFINSTIYPISFNMVSRNRQLKRLFEYFGYAQLMAYLNNDMPTFYKNKKEIEMILTTQSMSINKQTSSITISELIDTQISRNIQKVNKLIDYTRLGKQGSSLSSTPTWGEPIHVRNGILVHLNYKFDVENKKFSPTTITSLQNITDYQIRLYNSKLLSNTHKAMDYNVNKIYNKLKDYEISMSKNLSFKPKDYEAELLSVAYESEFTSRELNLSGFVKDYSATDRYIDWIKVIDLAKDIDTKTLELNGLLSTSYETFCLQLVRHDVQVCRYGKDVKILKELIHLDVDKPTMDLVSEIECVRAELKSINYLKDIKTESSKKMIQGTLRNNIGASTRITEIVNVGLQAMETLESELDISVKVIPFVANLKNLTTTISTNYRLTYKDKKNISIQKATFNTENNTKTCYILDSNVHTESNIKILSKICSELLEKDIDNIDMLLIRSKVIEKINKDFEPVKIQFVNKSFERQISMVIPTKDLIKNTSKINISNSNKLLNKELSSINKLYTDLLIDRVQKEYSIQCQLYLDLLRSKLVGIIDTKQLEQGVGTLDLSLPDDILKKIHHSVEQYIQFRYMDKINEDLSLSKVLDIDKNKQTSELLSKLPELECVIKEWVDHDVQMFQKDWSKMIDINYSFKNLQNQTINGAVIKTYVSDKVNKTFDSISKDILVDTGEKDFTTLTPHVSTQRIEKEIIEVGIVSYDKELKKTNDNPNLLTSDKLLTENVFQDDLDHYRKLNKPSSKYKHMAGLDKPQRNLRLSETIIEYDKIARPEEKRKAFGLMLKTNKNTVILPISSTESNNIDKAFTIVNTLVLSDRTIRSEEIDRTLDKFRRVLKPTNLPKRDKLLSRDTAHSCIKIYTNEQMDKFVKRYYDVPTIFTSDKVTKLGGKRLEELLRFDRSPDIRLDVDDSIEIYKKYGKDIYSLSNNYKLLQASGKTDFIMDTTDIYRKFTKQIESNIRDSLILLDSAKYVIINNKGNLKLNRGTSDIYVIHDPALLEMWRRWYFMPSDGPYDKMILPHDYPYAEKPFMGNSIHPFPGKDKALDEVLVDINIMANVIDFCYELWYANCVFYTRLTPKQTITNFINQLYEWLEKYVPDMIYKLPEYYPNDYESYANLDNERQDYWRLYRWIRWYAESIFFNDIPGWTENVLDGNHYIKLLLDNLVRYFNDHHGVYGKPGHKVLDKVKGIRHKWLRTSNKREV